MRYLALGAVYLAALIFGALAGFFVVFNAIFSDSGGPGEVMFGFGLVLATYGLLGLLFGFFSGSWLVGLLLAAPAMFLVVWYSFREPGNLPLHLAYIAVTLLAALLGAYGGAQVRTRAPRRST